MAHYAISDRAQRGGSSGGLSSERLQIVCVARLSPVKRVDVLLEALVQLVGRGVPVECTIVGGGPLLQSLKSFALERGLGARVTFTGHVSDTKRYIDQADVCVLSSDKEGLPLALVEAMAAGVPCVATDVGGTREIVLHGKTGLLVRPGMPHEFADALESLSKKPEMRLVMAQAAAEWARQEFDIERQMRKLKTVLLPVAV
ncbi:MAG: glycosyltransferase [Nitrospiraceae bacterium]